ncbi:MAG: long-chain-fatty-acid--CoA ligase [Chloroflexales bacterium]|nr:long-chain-fatty-acid--CoA ligase [Chloroflexales bacterium]
MSTLDSDQVWRQALIPQRLLDRSARVFPEKTAISYGSQRVSYRELAARVNRLASALRAAGVRPGDRVAFLCPNTPPLLEAHFGVPLAGAVLVAINTRLSKDEVSYILNHAGARLLFVDTELTAQIAPREQLPLLERIVTIVDAEAGAPGPLWSGEDYEGFLAGGSPEPLPELPARTEDDLIALNYTSGTTGQPKAVMYVNRGVYLSALGEGVALNLSSDCVYLWTLPMFHCNGWCFPWAVTAVGGTHVCLRRLEPAQIIELIATEQVSHFCAAPVVLIMLANHPAIGGLRLRRPLRIMTGGAPPSPTIIQTVEALGASIEHLYGLTETYGPYAICEWHGEWNSLPIEQRAVLKARQGVPYLQAGELRVVDEQLCDVPADGATLGEVVMRGNGVMRGYFNQPEATAEAFRGGWFHSGDVAVMHPDGYIELRDRKKDIIISGGENISTVEVERVIYQHPAVLEVAVVAAPDELWGESPRAFVCLKEDTQVSEHELITFCRARLAHYKCPRGVIFGDLPKTSTGKIQKAHLREQLWAGKQRRIN